MPVSVMAGKNTRESAVVAASDPLPDAGDTSWSSEVATTTTCSTGKLRKCYNCGRTHFQEKSTCPAEKLVCHSCGKVGHISKMCEKGKR